MMNIRIKNIASFLATIEIVYGVDLMETKRASIQYLGALMAGIIAYAGIVKNALIAHTGLIGGVSLSAVIVYLFYIELKFSIQFKKGEI